MDIESRLRKLERRYRSVLSAAVAAKADYLALSGESGSTSYARSRAENTWRTLETCKIAIVAQMEALEELEASGQPLRKPIRPDPASLASHRHTPS